MSEIKRWHPDNCGMVRHGDKSWEPEYDHNFSGLPYVRSDDHDAIAAELAAVKEIRQHGCECSDDDACQFARDRDKAQADLLLARQRIATLEAVLRCCLVDPRIPTDLWRVIESALASAETEVR